MKRNRSLRVRTCRSDFLPHIAQREVGPPRSCGINPAEICRQLRGDRRRACDERQRQIPRPRRACRIIPRRVATPRGTPLPQRYQVTSGENGGRHRRKLLEFEVDCAELGDRCDRVRAGGSLWRQVVDLDACEEGSDGSNSLDAERGAPDHGGVWTDSHLDVGLVGNNAVCGELDLHGQGHRDGDLRVVRVGDPCFAGQLQVARLALPEERRLVKLVGRA
mmetsp:Transcript_27441/g.66828  ORF Transcript_27441/g.66828 Transcript_27441/m.66828 type:complete len:220 (-) Transcript_27441:1133-1792(-)